GALGGRVETLTGDVGDPETVQRAVDRLGEVWGGLDVCIHNAGILGPRVPLAEYPLEDWQEVMRVNLTGTFLMAQGMLPLLRRKQGSMILLTSTVGRKGRA